MERSEGSRVIVASIIQLGHALGLQMVAEGIETPAQRERLTALGCDIGQGYLFAAAMPVTQLLEWCERQPRRLTGTLPLIPQRAAIGS